jgi:hypothetical protein
MNIHELRQAQVKFENRIEEITDGRKSLHQLRESFTRYFNTDKISKMGIDDYVAGVELPKKGYNFCYILERKLDGLGRISGSPAPKFGVYFGKRGKDSKDEYQFVKKFGKTYQEAFEGVRNAMLELLLAGKNENIEAIRNNVLSPMVKGKILSTYYPERYLNIFSPDHLDFFLNELDLFTEDLKIADPVDKREILIEFKNHDLIMKEWTVDQFANFLYNSYPGRPPKTTRTFNVKTDSLNSYRIPTFPLIQNAEFIELNFAPPTTTHALVNKRREPNVSEKIDYEDEARKLKSLGDRGEKIVLDLERRRLLLAGKKELAKKIERVSLKSDAFGYDILSFELDGTEKHIEVKATGAKVGPANFFLSANELRESKNSNVFCIYMVYEVISENPKVWVIGNPFNPVDINTVAVPVKYRISINTKE